MVTGISGINGQVYGWNRQVAGNNREQDDTATLENSGKLMNRTGVEERKEFQDRLIKQIKKQIKGENHAPYDYMAVDGCINYNGVTFICDVKNNQLCLGDVSDPHKCLIVSLENGGTLMVNHDKIGELNRAITMFTPEDQKRIMYAVSMYKKAKEVEEQIDDDTAGIGDSAEADLEENSEEAIPAENSEDIDD